MSTKAVVVGSFNSDLVLYVPRFPQPGETLHGHRFVTSPGGKGSNQAVACARLEANTTLIAAVGDDQFAQMGFDLWDECGIHTDQIHCLPNIATGVASIFVDDSSENFIGLAAGANFELTPQHVQDATDIIRAADIVLAQLEVPIDTVIETFKIARAGQVKTILNPAPATTNLPSELLRLADVITPNETELAILSGADTEDIIQAARSLMQHEGQTIVVTQGHKGATWVTSTDAGNVSAFAVEAVDTVGGGDAFNGGLAVALAEGKSLPDALQFANATAALAVMQVGAAESMPTRRDVEQFLQDHA